MRHICVKLVFALFYLTVGLKIIKNITLSAIVCNVLALLLSLCIAPIVTNLFNGTQSVVILTSDTAPGVQITKSMLSTVQVSKADAF